MRHRFSPRKLAAEVGLRDGRVMRAGDVVDGLPADLVAHVLAHYPGAHGGPSLVEVDEEPSPSPSPSPSPEPESPPAKSPARAARR